MKRLAGLGLAAFVVVSIGGETAWGQASDDARRGATGASAAAAVKPSEGRPAAWLWRPSGTHLYESGPLVTHPGGGAGGGDASRVQSNSLGLNTYGFGFNLAQGYHVADDFTVPAGGWRVDAVTVFGYQTGSSTTSTMTGLYYQVWDGPPNDPASTVVAGDVSVNCMSATAFTGIYRDLEGAEGDSQRPIMALTCPGPGALAAGTYWVEWAATGSLASGPWAPPITILGQTTTGDALQYTGGGWQALLDTGISTPQGLPFVFDGVAGQAGPDLSVALTDDVAFYLPEETLTYSIVATNLSTTDASTGARVTDAFPASLTGVAWTCAASAGSSCSASGSGNIDDTVDLAPGGTVSYTATGTVLAGTTGNLTNTATVVGTGDPVPANDSATDTDVPQPSLNLAYYTITPCRLMDTRNPSAPEPGPPLQGGQDRVVTAAPGCGIPAEAVALAVQFAVVAPSATGNISLRPAGTPATTTSSLNFVAGQTRSSNGVVSLNGRGAFAVRLSSGTSDLVIDVSGYFRALDES